MTDHRTSDDSGSRRPSRLWRLAEKEIRDNLNSLRFYLVLGLLAVLMAASLTVMVEDYQRRQENYSLLQAQNDASIAVLAPEELSLLVKGLDDTLAAPFYVGTTNGGIQMGSSQEQTSPLFSLVQTPDLLYIVQVILSLAALVLAYDLVCGEKERGTLRLLLSNDIRRSELILGKALGALLSLAVPFTLVYLAAIGVLTTLPSLDLTAGDLGRLAGIWFVSTLYAAVFIGLGLWISAAVRRSTTSLSLSLAVWMVLVLLLPRLSPTLGATIVDAPTARTVDAQVAEIRMRKVRQAEREVGELSSSDGDQITALYVRVEDEATDEILRLERSFFNRQNQQVAWASGLARLSPAASLTFAASDLAGTGLQELERLRQAVLGFKDTFVHRIYDNRLAPDDEQRELPRFQHRRASLSGGVQDASPDAALLGLWTVFAFAGAFFSFQRYDIR